MKYFNNCLQAGTRPNILFDNNGSCLACRYYNLSLGFADWEDRLVVANEIVDKYKRKPGQYFDCITGQYFDCIIGVSGRKDRTRQALWVCDKLGMTPL